jgi:hypothetical protein
MTFWVFSENTEDHMKHLEEFFEVVRWNYINLKKTSCFFGKIEIPFLGQWSGQGCIHMDSVKIRVI